jgi:hypothetical protein
LPLGTDEEVTGDPAGVMVEHSESEKRRPDGEARYEPTRRVTFRAGASQRAIDAGRGGDMMRRPRRPLNAPVRRTGDSMSSERRDCSGRRVAVTQSGSIRRVAVLPRLPEPLLPPQPEQRHAHRPAATRGHVRCRVQRGSDHQQAGRNDAAQAGSARLRRPAHHKSPGGKSRWRGLWGFPLLLRGLRSRSHHPHDVGNRCDRGKWAGRTAPV